MSNVLHRAILKGGEKVNQLRDAYNVNISVTMRDNVPPGLDENPVTIKGDTAENVNNCARDIQVETCVYYGRSEIIHEMISCL